MPSYLQRKYTDLILQASSKWVNWEPLIEIRVGAYGFVDKETGDLRVEGNIYDPEFQAELDKHGVKMNMANFLPQEGPVEDDLTVASCGAKCRDLDVDKEVDVEGTANAFVKGQWLFKHGKRDAILIMHNPRQIFLPPKVVLEPLYKVDKLIDKWLVTSIHVCPAYSMYLSDKSGDEVSLALVAQVPISSVTGVTNCGFTWWVDAQTGLLRTACDTTGLNYLYTPLFALKRPMGRIRKFCRDNIEPESEPEGDNLWCSPFPPWDPLDEDGEEDVIDVSMQDIDPLDPLAVGLAAP